MHSVFFLHILYEDTFIWCMECWIQSVVCNGPRTFVIFLLCNFAVVLLALEVLAMYLFQTITLTIMNRVLNFLGLIVFFALKLSWNDKAYSLAENRQIYLCNSYSCQVNTKNKFSRDHFDIAFSCQILSTCLHNNRISIANWRVAKAKTDEYLKLSFLWNIQTIHWVCFYLVLFHTSHIKTIKTLLSGLLSTW